MRVISAYILFLFAVSVSAAAQEDMVPEQDSAFVSVETRSKGYMVYIDSLFVGKSPVDSIKIKPGVHTINVKPSDSDLWAEVEWSDSINVSSGEHKIIQVPLLRYVLINSIPYGAKVVLRGRNVGTTPYLLTESDVSVELVISGYLPTRIEPEDLKDIGFYTATLTQEDPLAGSYKRILTPSISGRLESNVTRTSLIFTVVTGAASAYYKYKADKAYEKYQEAVNPEDIVYYLDETDRYDNIGSITFGAFQGSLLFSVYWMLRK